jgi:putative membrane protein
VSAFLIVPMPDRSPRALAKNYARGLLMGGSDVIPGVSGGTMALILGIYERLIGSISSAFSMVTSLLRGRRGDFGDHAREVEWSLVIPLGLGIVTAIALAASVILGLIERYPHHTQALFFGLVTASIAVPWMRMKARGAREAVVAIVCAIVAFLLVGLPQSVADDPNLLRVFASASIAICAMILPGVSGAFLLKAMGIYEPTLGALREVDILYVGTFVLGAAIGIGLFSKLLAWLLDHKHDLTMAALIGLMAGALRSLWPYLAEDGSLLLPVGDDPILSVIAIGIVGFALVAALIYFGQRATDRDRSVDQPIDHSPTPRQRTMTSTAEVDEVPPSDRMK